MAHQTIIVLDFGSQFTQLIARRLRELSVYCEILPFNTSLDAIQAKAPIGLILCAESSREQVELLQMHKDGITVAEYWTELPPKAELEQTLHAALLEARERLARRRVLLGDLDEE